MAARNRPHGLVLIPLVVLTTSVALAADYSFTATVTSVQSDGGPFASYFGVGQTLLGSVGFDETLAPSGFLDPGMTTSFFEHPTPNFRRGMRIKVGKLQAILPDGLDPQRIERTSDATDFVMRTTAFFEDAAPYGAQVMAPVSLDLVLEDLAAPVDYLTLPDPLSPVVPSSLNRLIVSAGTDFDAGCVAPNDCVAIAEIVAFASDTDSDDDGVLDAMDTCVDLAHSCQRDGDSDGYGNPCDTDLNNDGATGFDDLSEILEAAVLPVLGPEWDRYDINCDGAHALDDVSQVWFDAISIEQPGPSGLSCAGTVPCP